MAKNDTDLETNAAILAGILIIPMIVLWTSLWIIIDAFIFMNMWSWWVAPAFNIAQITLLQAAGLSVLLGYFRNHHYYDFKKKILQGIATDLIMFGISAFMFYFL